MKPHTSRAIRFLAAFVTCAATTWCPAAEDLSKGKQIYVQQCADCHGADGSGVKSIYPEPLIGDLSIPELANYISVAMPEGEPEACQAEDAEAVARYIHGEFYSLIAQVRNQPPRIELSRLTVRQYKNSVTDLENSFHWSGTWDEKRGVEGSYYKNRKRRNENKAIERTDSRIAFDFGEEPPGEEIEKEEYAIDWKGGVLAPETGWYEIILDTPNAGSVWLNSPDYSQKLIDARVKSGDQTEYVESIFLLGGRVYPLRVEFYKSKNEKTAAVHLKWRTPHGATEIIPERYLTPNNFPALLVVETDFPPDDKSVGYERGISVSREWNDATTRAAIEVADKLLTHTKVLSNFSEEKLPEVKKWCKTFVSTAFRRPLTDELEQFYIERQFASCEEPATAVKRIILLTLKSPRFLFPYVADTSFDQYEVANWLALTLWDSIPDKRLLEMAGKGELNSSEQIRRQAERMVADIRCRAKVQAFFRQWLHFDHFQELSKSSQLYPGFDAQLTNDLKASLEIFVEETVWSDSSDYRQLLLDDSIYLNDRLATFYQTEKATQGPAFEKVRFEPEQRAGLITHPFLMSGLAYDAETSPIHRGVFLSRRLLGRFLKPPPIAVSPTPVELDPDLTTRERVAKQTASVNCIACHGMINPLGFSLEHFDAVGRYREEDAGRPVDATGRYINRSGEEKDFEGARGLAEFVASSPEAHAAFTEQLFQYLLKQPIQAFGPEMLGNLKDSFAENNFNIRTLLATIATESVLHAQKKASPEQVAEGAK